MRNCGKLMDIRLTPWDCGISDVSVTTDFVHITSRRQLWHLYALLAFSSSSPHTKVHKNKKKATQKKYLLFYYTSKKKERKKEEEKRRKNYKLLIIIFN